jgi:hypothetical protein
MLLPCYQVDRLSGKSVQIKKAKKYPANRCSQFLANDVKHGLNTLFRIRSGSAGGLKLCRGGSRDTTTSSHKR